MIDGLILEPGRFGLRAVITSAWTDEIAAYLRNSEIGELVLNDGKGWRGDNVEFLRDFPKLQALRILDLKLASVEPIHSLHQLRALDVITYCRTPLRFSEFPLLEDCAFEWRPKATSVFACANLRNLFINRYKGQDTSPFGALVNLVSLAILNGPLKSLDGLGKLTNLKSLRLAGLTRLPLLAGLELLDNLEELDFNTCRAFSSIDEIGSLSKLKILGLNNCGDIESLRPLLKLRCLESVSFYESTNILDGDLSPLTGQSGLRLVTFQNRKHYSHRRQEFGLQTGGDRWTTNTNESY